MSIAKKNLNSNFLQNKNRPQTWPILKNNYNYFSKVYNQFKIDYEKVVLNFETKTYESQSKKATTRKLNSFFFFSFLIKL